MEIYEIVKKLIGEIKPVGETNIDEERLKNIEEHMNLVEQLLWELQEVATNKDRVEYSMKELGTKAHNCIENLKTSL